MKVSFSKKYQGNRALYSYLSLILLVICDMFYLPSLVLLRLTEETKQLDNILTYVNNPLQVQQFSIYMTYHLYLVVLLFITMNTHTALAIWLSYFSLWTND